MRVSSAFALAVLFFGPNAFPAPEGFSTEAEFGWVISTGNSDTSTLSFKDSNFYRFSSNEFRFDARYLTASTGSVQTAQNWGLGLRYSYDLSKKIALFLSQSVEGNSFAGLLQRYNTDAGVKYTLMTKEDGLEWFVEAGYRMINENPTIGARSTSHAARAYTELSKSVSENLSLKLWAEYIPNFSIPSDWLLNTELSGSLMISKALSLKVGYLLKYDNLLNVGATKNLDTILTSALVAKF